MEYIIFKYFWLIAILPKIVQMPIFLIISIILWYKRRNIKVKSDSFISTFIIIAVTYLFSIITAIVSSEHQMDRILAAINTCLITFVGCNLYLIYKEISIDLYIISKIMFHNVLILFLLYIFFLLVGVDGNFQFMNGPLCGYDYIGGRVELRFKGYLEYSNLVPYMYLYCLPISLIYVQHKYGRLGVFLYEIISILPVFASNSRSGTVCAIVVLLLPT